MATEQYSIGYEEGYQAGWNEAMDAKQEQPEEDLYDLAVRADNEGQP